MAEKIIPFARTVLLPAGSPAIGCVDGLRMDVSGLQCHWTGQACYCLGDVDVLIEYHAVPSDSGSLFYGPSEPGRAWQALLSIPVELPCDTVEDPLPLPPGSYQPRLGHLEWFMVASNAIELEGSLVLSWEETEPTDSQPAPGEAVAPAPEEATPEAEAEPQPQPTEEQAASAEEAAGASFGQLPAEQEEEVLPRGLICRPEHFVRRGEQAYQSRGWNMVTYNEEQTAEAQLVQENATVEAQIQELAARAEQTAAEARQLWEEIEQRQSGQSESEENAEAETETEANVEANAQEDENAQEAGIFFREAQKEEPAPPAESPPSVTLDARQLQAALSLSLSEEDGEMDEDEREIDLREGVVVRMRFEPPSASEQKKLYYPGPVPEEKTDPNILAETLQEALGEESPRPSARLRFSWEANADALDEKEKAAGEEAADPAALSQEAAAEIAVPAVEEAPGESDPDPKAGRALAAEDPKEQPAACPIELTVQEPVQELVQVQEQAPMPEPEMEAAQPSPSMPQEAEAAIPPRDSESAALRVDPPAEHREEPILPEAAAELPQPEDHAGAASLQAEPPRVEADQLAMREALDAALEPELLPPTEKQSRRRRAVGLPRLHIDANDNRVEISAFNLQIKL